MQLSKLKVSLLFFVVSLSTWSCDPLKKASANLNIFPIEQDKQLGLQVKQEIAGNPSEYKVLDRSQYAKAYYHLDRIMNAILNSGQLKHRNDFAWEAYIIQDDNTLNAFCTPGGYIYVYSGLIKYLDNESDLAGVLGHEIAHADQRHSTAQLTNQYGLEIISAIALGEKSNTTVAQIAKSLATLKFSRSHEADADEHSVKYLCPTSYKADGAASFFEKLIKNEQAGGTPAFLSTHPSPSSRVADITETKNEMGCKGNSTNVSQYNEFKSYLPK